MLRPQEVGLLVLLSRMLLTLSENERFMATLVDMPAAGGEGRVSGIHPPSSAVGWGGVRFGTSRPFFSRRKADCSRGFKKELGSAQAGLRQNKREAPNRFQPTWSTRSRLVRLHRISSLPRSLLLLLLLLRRTWQT